MMGVVACPSLLARGVVCKTVGVVALRLSPARGVCERVGVVAHPSSPARGVVCKRAGVVLKRVGVVPKTTGVVACPSSPARGAVIKTAWVVALRLPPVARGVCTPLVACQGSGVQDSSGG